MVLFAWKPAHARHIPGLSEVKWRALRLGTKGKPK